MITLQWASTIQNDCLIWLEELVSSHYLSFPLSFSLSVSLVTAKDQFFISFFAVFYSIIAK